MKRTALLAPIALLVPAAALSLVVSCAPPYPPPPATRVAEVVDTLHGVEVPDPYRWLEDQDSAETRRWIDEQNAYAERIVGQPPLRARLAGRLGDLMDTDETETPRRGGDFEYFTMRRKGEELPIVYRRPAPAGAGEAGAPATSGRSSRPDPAGTYEVVIDPHPMSPDRTTRVEIVAVERTGARLIYSVRDGGQDEVEIRVRDLASGGDLPDRLPAALYSSVSFARDAGGFYYSRRSRETGARILFHAWGEPVDQDEVVFGEGYGPTAFVSMTQADEGRVFIYTVQHGWARTEVFVQDARRARPPTPVVTDADARFYPRMVGGELWMRTDLDASNNRLVAVDPASPAPDRWRVVIPETDEVMEDFTVIGDRVYVTYLSDATNRIRVFEKDGTPAGEIDVPPLSQASIRGEGDGEALLTVESFTSPATTWRLDLETGERTIEEPPDVTWDASAVEVEQVWAASKDATRVPLFVVHRRGIALDGSHPALLTGYGGFYAARKPDFSATAATWVESGGVYAVAVLRGGSEFGERWHRAGMLLDKQNVFDDFIAAAEWLVSSGYTSPERLAIQGASNGGLLVGAALTQRPDLFRAVSCAFPDVDILRFHRFTRTNNMPALLEYGDASIPEHFETIRKYSPYQNVRAGTAYPAVLVATGDLDTRVPPLAGRKFAARLQAATSSGLPVILRYHPKAGHAAGRGLPFSRRLEDAALELTFLMAQLGMPVE